MLNEHLDNNLSEISAEMLLNYLYPDLADRWIVQAEGTFYRNYNSDLLAYDDEAAVVQLSRDSFNQLLPQGLLYRSVERGKVNSEKLMARKRLLMDLFQPFDTFAFRCRLSLEREISSLLETRLQEILSRFFGFDLASEQNSYIREAAVLLPFVSHLRGDLYFVRDLLSSLFRCEVQLTIGRYSETDNTRSWLPSVRYEIIMPELTTEQYNSLMDDVRPLNEFVCEWFMPMEAKCFIDIKWKDIDLPQTPVLNYNTHLKK